MLKPFSTSIKTALGAMFLISCGAAAEDVQTDRDPASGTLLVGNKGEDTLSFIDLKTGRETARKKTGPNPHEIAISPDGLTAAVVNYGSDTIDVFEIASQSKIETISLAPNKRPHGIVWLDDWRIIATTEGSDSLTIVSPPVDDTLDRKISAISTGQKGSHMVAVSPDKKRAFVANMGSGTVSVLDLDAMTKVTDLPAGTEPEGLALTPDGKSLWVADRRSDELHVFDTTNLKKVKTLPTGKFPIRVAISPDGKTAVTSELADGAIGLFDVQTVAPRKQIKISGSQDSGQVTLLFSDNGKRLYAAETGLNRIAEIDMETGKLIGRLPAGKNGDGLGIAVSRD